MKFLRNSTLALLIVGQSLSAQTLDRAACDFIEAFDLKNDTTFVENFLFMNHNAEGCIGGTNCYRPISKRTLPVSMTLGEFLPSDPKALEISLLSLANMSVWFSSIANLEVQLVDRTSVPELGAGFIRVEVVDEDNALKILGTKFSRAQNEFRKFIENDQVKCLAVKGDWANHGIEYAEAWIKTDQSYNDLSQCLTEEVYHTFGVISDPIGLASLYSDPTWLPEQPGAPDFTYPANRDVLIMKVLYDDLIKNGDEIETSRRKVEEIIQRDCGQRSTQ